MANYLTKLSFVIATEGKDPTAFFEFVNALEEACEAQLEIQDNEPVDIEGPEGWPDPTQMMTDFDFNMGFHATMDTDVREAKIWIRDEDGVPNTDLLIRLVELAVEKMDLQSPVSFQWANTCSRPLLDGFGGGIAVIARDADGQVQTRSQATAHMLGALIQEIGMSHAAPAEDSTPSSGGMI